MRAEQIDDLKRDADPRFIRLVTRRRVLMTFAALAAVLVPLAALAAANDWWFLRFGGAPVPASAPQVVKEGEWDGHAWQLIAYPSRTDGLLCVSMTPKDSVEKGEGAALSCSQFVGVARTPESKASPDMTITLMAGAGSEKLPAYIAGAVIESASAVEIRLADGDLLRVPTYAGPEPLQHVRFYAAQLPAHIQMTPENFTRVFPSWVAGLDSNGNVIACLAPRTAKDGISIRSDCR